MRRWNGWGDDTIQYPLSARSRAFLVDAVGASTPPRDVAPADVLAAVPPSRLTNWPEPSLIHVEAGDRLRHARGQSLPDWVALRSGCIPAFPDAVAYPLSSAEVARLLEHAALVDARVIPYGGGTSVVGHINPEPGDRPVLTINMRRMNQISQLDSISQLATFGAGVAGPELEAQLRVRGFTLGHFPQSFEFSTLGGWVATRSSGQQSLGYGRIENLFAGGRLLAPAGDMVLPPFPASAAGPDLRQVILGSEGRMGILTDITVRITPLPELEEFYAAFFPSFIDGMTATRRIVQERLPLSLLRLSTPMETKTTLALAGHERLIGLLETMLGVRGVSDEKCMLLCGFTGRTAAVRDARHATLDIIKEHSGVNAGRRFGEQWIEGRFRTPYLRNTLWEMGYAVDTLETATTWQAVPRLVEQIEEAMYSALDDGERVHVFTHLSHMYPQGASIYVTYIFRLAPDPDETLRRWAVLKGAASRAIMAGGGTISHQHGVGRDHAAYLETEKGALGLTALETAATAFDPAGIMNPGVLFNRRKGEE